MGGVEPNPKEGLVVLQQHVQGWLVQFDKTFLKQNGLLFAICHAKFGTSRNTQKFFQPGAAVGAFTSINLHAFAQVDGLANVEDFFVGIEEQIDAWTGRCGAADASLRR